MSSTESDVDMHIDKTWIAIDWLSTLQKSDHSDQMKQKSLQALAMSVLLYSCTTLIKCLEKNLDVNYTR